MVTGQAPRLESARLRLRGHRETDLPDCHAMWSDPLVARYLGGRALTLEETWARLLRYVGHWTLKGFGYWVLEEKQSGKLVGEIGFADFKREISSQLDGIPEIGWVLAAWAQGQGLGTEAAVRALEWGKRNLAAQRTVCLIHPENAPSIRIASKLGFEELGRIEYRGWPAILFSGSLNS